MRYQYENVQGINIFYRECGSSDLPTMILFHGFPSASHMFRDLMPMLEKRFHLIAPDYPGFARDTVIGQYTFGTIPGSVSPDGYTLDLYYASTIPDYAEKQSDLIFDYQNNIKLYPAFQAYLRKFQPRLLAVWGKNDPSFVWPGAEAFRKDVPDAKIVPVESGHFALESCCKEIADQIMVFYGE